MGEQTTQQQQRTTRPEQRESPVRVAGPGAVRLAQLAAALGRRTGGRFAPPDGPAQLAPNKLAQLAARNEPVQVATIHTRPPLGPLPAMPVQCTKRTKDGIVYADTAKEAEDLMTAYAERIGVKVSRETMEIAISVATQKEQGIDQAELIIFQTLKDVAIKKKQDEIYAKFSKDFAKLKEEAAGDDLCAQALDAAFNRLVHDRTNPNLTLGKSYTQEEVNEAVDYWKQLNGVAETEKVTFHGFKRQDKAAMGKANVGDTHETRKVQANLLSTWGQTKINVHVNISG